MDKDLIEFIGTCVVIIAQIYTFQGEHFPYIAWLWDKLAIIFGHLANAFGFWSMYARQNYYMAVSSYGGA